jgi:excisionase family DNA binding protein
LKAISKGENHVSDVLTVDQVAKELQIHSKTVYQLIKDGRLKAMNVGTKSRTSYRIDRKDLEDFKEQSKQS